MRITKAGKLILGAITAASSIVFALTLLGATYLEGAIAGVIFIGLGSFVIVETLLEQKGRPFALSMVFKNYISIFAIGIGSSSIFIGLYLSLFKELPEILIGFTVIMAVLNAIIAITEMFN